MKKILFIIFICSTFIYGQDNITYKNFNSFELNAKRTLKIYLPASYDDDDANTYPVAVIFDAEYLFDVYVANAKLFASRNKAPEQIVVGIFQNQNEERYIDCDYSTDTGLPNEDGNKFYRFVREEVLNYIDDNYRTSLFKTIVGNTLTANFLNYFFLESYHPFNAYININPSYATQIQERIEAKSQNISTEVYYYLSSGDFNLEKRKKAINGVNSLLKLSENEYFKYKFDDFSNSTKTASIGQAIPSAMGFVFNMFAPISKTEFDTTIAQMSPGEAIEYLEKKYVEIDYLYGSNVKIRENDIYIIEPIIMDKANGDYLEEFGKMIIRLYPESPMGDYYIGYYYETGYDYRKALKYYKNGYAKIGSDNPNGDGYYANIERVLDKQRAEKLGYPVGDDSLEETEETGEAEVEENNN
jgi:predicted alpha/beta superfamily hydrolase